jgi:putative transposase
VLNATFQLLRLEITKTVRIPVHYALTKRKLGILEHLTARHSHCVQLFSKLIEERNMNVIKKYGEFTKAEVTPVRKLTRLNVAYMQQCRDQALWMWKSYRELHREWERRLNHAKGKWRGKLLEREPKRPFQNGFARKIPIRIDQRTGAVEPSHRIRLAPYVLRLSTLKKGMRITVPLNLAKYHLDFLGKGRVVDFQLVKRDGWYRAHVCVKYHVPDVPVQAVRGVDLGVRRAIATVLLKPNQPLRRINLSILRDNRKKHRLGMLNRRIAEVQRAKKWEPLKRLRHKRRCVADYYDRIIAIRIARMAMLERSMVAVGYPKDIKYENYRGNGNRKLRRMLQQRFSYGRMMRYILEECQERGVMAEAVLEGWTSRRCHRCGSTDTRRPTQSLFWCLHCSLQYNADWNATINIGSVFLPTALSRGATEGSAQAGDELAHKRASPEAEKQTLTPACQRA